MNQRSQTWSEREPFRSFWGRQLSSWRTQTRPKARRCLGDDNPMPLLKNKNRFQHIDRTDLLQLSSVINCCAGDLFRWIDLCSETLVHHLRGRDAPERSRCWRKRCEGMALERRACRRGCWESWQGCPGVTSPRKRSPLRASWIGPPRYSFSLRICLKMGHQNAAAGGTLVEP